MKTLDHEEKKWYVCKVPMTGYDGYAICYALHYSHAILLGCHKCNKNKRYVATSLCKSDNAMRRTSGKTSPVVGMPPRRCHTCFGSCVAEVLLLLAKRGPKGRSR